jgi:copper chaperone CopZ
MFRRRFLQFIPLATALGLAPLKAMAKDTVAKGNSEVVTYRVKGFSCVTCATGLDTMLGQQKGVASSKSTYPEGVVKVTFDPEEISKNQIADFIVELGFKVEAVS